MIANQLLFFGMWSCGHGFLNRVGRSRLAHCQLFQTISVVVLGMLSPSGPLSLWLLS